MNRMFSVDNDDDGAFIAHFLCGYANSLYTAVRGRNQDYLQVHVATLQFTVFEDTSNRSPFTRQCKRQLM